jgi:hypothetical protein
MVITDAPAASPAATSWRIEGGTPLEGTVDLYGARTQSASS